MITEIIFRGRVPGMNDKDGLIRMHWSKKKELLKRYQYEARSATTNRHTGPVRIELIRHTTGSVPMDRDNLMSTAKGPIDAIVKAGILPNDSPDVVVDIQCSQTKAINKESQFTLIRIIDIETP